MVKLDPKSNLQKNLSYGGCDSSHQKDDEDGSYKKSLQIGDVDRNDGTTEKDRHSSMSQFLESSTKTFMNRLVRFSPSPKSHMFEEKSFESLRKFDASSSKSKISEVTDSSTYRNKAELWKQNEERGLAKDNNIIQNDDSSLTVEFRHSTTQYTGYNVLNELLSNETIDTESFRSSVRTQKDVETLLCSEEELAPLNYKSKLTKSNSSRLLLKLAAAEKTRTIKDAKILIQMAAVYLSDHESGRQCSLPTSTLQDDTSLSLRVTLYRIRHSSLWMFNQRLAIFAIFFSSCYEGFSSTYNLAAAFSIFFLIVFSIDLFVLRRHYHHFSVKEPQNNIQEKRNSSSAWSGALLCLIIAVTIETVVNIIYTNPKIYALSSSYSFEDDVQYQTPLTLLVGVTKPIAFFYLSRRARDALEALKKVIPIITKVILMELFVILSFAAVACHLFSNTEHYDNLSISFLSLFQLSTTVVNPSIWMPVYHEQRTAALFFILFIVICVFYLHSLVLTVVYQVYIQAMTKVHDQRNHDKEEALKLSFFTLQKLNYSQSVEEKEELVKTKHLKEMLKIVRPHYGPMKILALVRILDPTNSGAIDFTSFRRNIPKALLISLRSTERRRHSSVILDLLTLTVATVNLAYILTFSFIANNTDWLKEDSKLHAGTIITILCIFELVLRVNPFYEFSSSITFSKSLDGLALVASFVSLYGVILLVTEHPDAESYILIGRAIDMIRVMRYFGTFNSIAQRSVEACSTLVGTLALIITWMHVFVYFGMSVWRGTIHVGKHAGVITPLYDLNNFNSYTSGLVTMFQILVVNDWHAIANVFLFGDKYSSPFIVWAFFIMSNLTGVTILSVMTAFFIGSFTTKVDGNNIVLTKDGIDRPQASVRISPFKLKKHEENMVDSDSETSQNSASLSPHEYNIFERQGYSQILKSLIGDTNDEANVSRDICFILELFESLSPGVEKVGYLICCQKTGDRFGNRRFLSMAQQYINENDLHEVVTEMIIELKSKLPKRRLAEAKIDFHIQRTYNCSQGDNITKFLVLMASVIPQTPNITMFTARECKENI